MDEKRFMHKQRVKYKICACGAKVVIDTDHDCHTTDRKALSIRIEDSLKRMKKKS